MTYKTLMVNLNLSQANTAVLQAAAYLSVRFHADVIGIAAGQLMARVYAGGYAAAPIINQEREDVERDLRAAETEFRDALQSRVETIEWRSTATFGSPTGYVAAEARSADLLIAGIGSKLYTNVHTSDLIMDAGRPVLIVPSDNDGLNANRVLIAWKDTRETRRAVSDALPLLRDATHVFVVEMASEHAWVEARRCTHDVVRWLERHGIAAQAIVSSSHGNDSTRLNELAKEHQAGIIVAGAYGHSRMREWILGGVTREMLHSTEYVSLLSH